MMDGQSTTAAGTAWGSVSPWSDCAAHRARRTDRARPVCKARHEDQMLNDMMLADESEWRGVCGMRERLAIQGRFSLSLLETGYRQCSTPRHHAIR